MSWFRIIVTVILLRLFVSVTERDVETRRDLREARVFTIDPSGARDLDDALSIKKNDDGTYEVGVHIADVSHFVKVNTPLDRDARKRATTVYLVQRAVPMFPPALSEELCSLLPHQDRLAFSVIFTLNEEAHVIKKWVGKTIINSAAQLTYQQAQAVIDGKSLTGASISQGHDAAGIEQDIRSLHALAHKILGQRKRLGMLKTHSPRLVFQLDENRVPVDCQTEESDDAHSLVEEVSDSIRCGTILTEYMPVVYAASQYHRCATNRRTCPGASVAPAS